MDKGHRDRDKDDTFQKTHQENKRKPAHETEYSYEIPNLQFLQDHRPSIGQKLHHNLSESILGKILARYLSNFACAARSIGLWRHNESGDCVNLLEEQLS